MSDFSVKYIKNTEGLLLMKRSRVPFQRRSCGWRLRTLTFSLCSSLGLSVNYSLVLWSSLVLICRSIR
uniref:Uncharacterized protein n=1 Tax=Lepeophtheirus salmonis TaxID=72036 RepID=A0A0K2V1S9_LEPSM